MRIIAVIACGLSLAGCATVTRGTTSQVQFTSDPSGAEVRTSLGHTCRTPCTLQFNRRDEFTARFEMPGREAQEIPVRTMVAAEGAAGFAGNLILGGVVGMAADAATGATLQHTPNPVHARMPPIPAAQPPRAAPPPRRRPGRPIS